ncbi:MAG: hypothetical protein VX460_09470 [Planctomycetota bacterium]|nr:hypothetical protein [Planctomycetota bacterium]
MERPRQAQAVRLSWFAGGAVCAAVAGMVLGPAVAAGPQDDLRPIPTTAAGMASDSNNRMIAVTGVDITGQSVLYLVDTEAKQLAVYQASGGAAGTNSVRLVGARRIELDMELDGFNDKTTIDGKPLTYKDLARRFEREVDTK